MQQELAKYAQYVGINTLYYCKHRHARVGISNKHLQLSTTHLGIVKILRGTHWYLFEKNVDPHCVRDEST